MRKLLLNKIHLNTALNRLARQIWEKHENADDFCLIGLQPRGIYPAFALKQILEGLYNQQVAIGKLDVTFFRDDFGRKDSPLAANHTELDFSIEGKKVILIDDVLYTGRSVRSALDALIAFGRPAKVELLVLVERRLARELPVEANYTGLQVDSIKTQRVLVEWQQAGKAEDSIWLLE